MFPRKDNLNKVAGIDDQKEEKHSRQWEEDVQMQSCERFHHVQGTVRSGWLEEWASGR